MALAVRGSVVGASTSASHSVAHFCSSCPSSRPYQGIITKRPAELAFFSDNCHAFTAVYATKKRIGNCGHPKRNWVNVFRALSASGQGNDANDNSDTGGGEEFEVKKALDDVLRNDYSHHLLDRLADRVLKGEESEALLKDFAAAAGRVAKAKEELNLIDKKEKDLADMVSQMISRTIDEETQVASLIAEREFAVRAAEEELKAAEIALITARAGSSIRDLGRKWENGEDIDEDMEREESGKAAAVAALAGTLANLPFLLTGKDVGIGPLLSIVGVLVSCALFGVTYRYIVRRDLGNIQLKLGAASAFAIVRGIGQLDVVQRLVGLSAASASDIALTAFNATEGLFTFGFSVLALDYCMREGLLRPFPSKNL